MIMKKILFYTLSLVVCFLSFGQAHVPYEPVVLSDSVNSEYSEINPVISPDGQTLYFSRLNHPNNNYGAENSQDVWYSERQDDKSWGPAVHMESRVNLHKFNSVYAVLDDGNTLLINGIYNYKGKYIKRGLSYIYKVGDTWSNPEEIKVKGLTRVNKGDHFTAYIDQGKSILVMSFSKTYKGNTNNIYISLAKGTNFKNPKKIKISKHFKIEQAPVLNVTGDTIFFAGNQGVKDIKKNKKEDLDIYYTVKQDVDYKQWSDPQELTCRDTSSELNTTNFESYLRLNEKGDIAYFVSNREKGKGSDIYTFRRWDENPYIAVSGFVKNKFKNAVLSNEYDFNLEFSYQEGDSLVVFTPDSLVIDSDTMSYSCHLPFGKKVQIKPIVENFTSDITTIDGSDIYDHTTLTADVFVIPLSYAKITGVILNKESKTPITDEGFSPEIFVNGIKYDSITIDEVGRFEFNLSLGESYAIEARADGYITIGSTLTLEGTDTYREIEHNLYLEKEPDITAHITGKITSKKDNSIINPDDYHLLLNGEKVENVTYKNGKYDITVELGKDYFLKVQSDKYIPDADSISLKDETENIKIVKNFKITPIEVGQKVKIKNIYFTSGKAQLLSTSFPSLDKLVEFMSEKESIKVEIGGHTDNIGNDLYNKKLSKMRADAVIKYIVSKGISEDRFTAKGYGEETPIASNDDEEHRALNRRVEFKITEL